MKQTIQATLAVALTTCLSPFACAEEPVKPNVLFIAVDDLKPILGCYGDTKIKTPNIDRLASRGTVFLNAHCQQAVCAPSRASLLTGLRPDTTRIYDLKTRIRSILPDVVTLPEYFKQHGYESVGMGKIFDPRSVNGQAKDDPRSWSRPYLPVADGSETELGYANPTLVAAVREAKKTRVKGDDWEGIKKVFGGTPSVEIDQDVPDETYSDGRMSAQAVKTIGEFASKKTPFFLAVGFKKPHLPFVAPKKYADLYDRTKIELAQNQSMPEGAPGVAFQDSWELKNGSYSDTANAEGRLPDEKQRELIHGYMACVSYMDAQVGKLLDALDKQGLAENTIIVFWGDHGFHLGDHGMWCKHTNYEQATRVPLIISAGQGKGQSGKSTSPVELVDIFPTLCGLAGIPVPESLHGVSLQPILNDAAASVKDFAMSQYPRGNEANEVMGYTLRDARYRYVRWLPKGAKAPAKIEEEFYDYSTAPLETRNLISDPQYAETVATMRAAADRLIGPQKQP